MLSKLIYYKTKINLPSLATYFGLKENELDLKALNGGTLGVTYKLTLPSGIEYFLKTYDKNKKTLDKEVLLLKAANPNCLNLMAKKFVLPNNEVGLMMKFLQPCKSVNPNEMLSIINSYQSGLSQIMYKNLYTINDLISNALCELKNMMNANFFEKELALFCYEDLKEFEKDIDKYPKIICHGDLGIRNIIKNNDDFVVVDWEDAFWGIQGYDYLYWLTFFKNRPLYSKEVFCKCNLDVKTIKSVLILILILKISLSFYNGVYKTNSLSGEERLREVLDCLN